MADTSFLRVHAHEDLKRRLARAVEEGTLPQSLLLYGPRGVGKQRLAIWTAAALDCQTAGSPPCGRCRSCRLVGRLEHPDVHWFFPLPRPKRVSGPDRLLDALEDARAAALEERRSNPDYVEEYDGPVGIYIAAVHAMRRQAIAAPVMGPAKVLVIGRAESLIAQTGSAEAANALLKLLEEPPANTYVILTSDTPGALLPTIRSRVQAIRVGPLPVERVEEFLRDRAGLDETSAHRIARQSDGSIGRALEHGDESHEELRASAERLLQDLLTGGPTGRWSAAHRQRSWGARGAFSRLLSELAALLRDLLALSLGADDAVADPRIRRLAGRSRAPAVPAAAQLIRALRAVTDAQELAERNVNPQLIIAELMRRARFQNTG